MIETLSVDDDEVARALASGDVRACARLITKIERGGNQLVPLLQRLYRKGGSGRTVGITGPPGAGKSTLVSQLVKMWRQSGLKVAVLAVDPSSPFSGGAVLGDRYRMVEHGCDDGVFIRSMASRGQLGGLAKAAGDALTALCAMPWDIVLIETVGVGQNETDIMRYAEVVVLLQTPMGGDDMQAAKAGVLEIADIFVVNKGDHPQADQTVRQISEMVNLGHYLHPDRSWVPPVIKAQANCGSGVPDLVNHIERRFGHLAANPDIANKFRDERLKHRVGEILQDMLRQKLRAQDESWLNGMIDRVASRHSDPYELAATLLARI